MAEASAAWVAGRRRGRWFTWPFRALTRWFRRFDELTGENPSARAVFLLVLAWTALIWLWSVMSEAPRGLFFDFLEAYAWSTGFEASAPRHPPMIGWLTGLWFTVMPRTSVSFLTAGALMTGLMLWLFYLLFVEILPPGKRVAALAIVALEPMLAANGLYFNANTLQAPFWTLATLFFLRSFRTRAALPAALAGLAGGAAVLTKYFGAFLPMGLAVATFFHPGWRRFWLSPAPYVAGVFFALALVPHLLWVLDHEVTPLNYYNAIHTLPLGEAIRNGIKFVLVIVPSWAALPVIVFLAVVRPSRAQLLAIVAPKDPEHRLWLAAFLAPILIATVVCSALSQKISNPWIYPAWSLLAPVLLAPAAVVVTVRIRAALLTGMIAYALLLACVAPFVVLLKDLYVAPTYAFSRQMAPVIEAEWERRFGNQLPFVGGDAAFSYGVAFYGRSDAISFPVLDPGQAPWIDPEEVERRGMVVLCPVTNQSCLARMEERLRGRTEAFRLDLSVTSRLYFKTYTSPTIRAGFVPPIGETPSQSR